MLRDKAGPSQLAIHTCHQRRIVRIVALEQQPGATVNLLKIEHRVTGAVSEKKTEENERQNTQPKKYPAFRSRPCHSGSSGLRGDEEHSIHTAPVIHSPKSRATS